MLVSEAQARAEEVRHRSEQEVRRRREAAEHELRRIAGLHEGVRGEMGRLHTLLGAELTGAGNGRGGDGALRHSACSAELRRADRSPIRRRSPTRAGTRRCAACAGAAVGCSV